MVGEDSIFDEINEELKNDKILAFFKDNQKAILSVVACMCIGIVLYSFWYSQKKQQLEISTANLFQELYASGKRSDAAIDNLRKSAPAELVPLLSIVGFGRKMAAADDLKKNAASLLALSERNGVDVIWKDIAILIYASYRLESSEQLIKRLIPLCDENRPFRYTAMEQIAMTYESMGNHEKSVEYLSKIVEANDAPNTMKQRISKLINYIRNNFGERK